MANRFVFKGVVYNSLKDAYEKFNVKYNDVYIWMKRHNISDKAEGLEDYLNWKANKEFIFRGVNYSSFSDVCRNFNVDRIYVLNWMRHHNITDKTEGLEKYLDIKANEGILFRGVKYNSFRDVCRKFNVEYDNVQHWIIRNNISDKAEGFEMYLEKNKFIFRGVIYNDFRDACENFNVIYSAVYSWMNYHNITDRAEGLEDYLNMKANQGFLFRGVNYGSFKEACDVNKVKYYVVQTWMSKRNITDKAEGLDAYLNKGFLFKGVIYHSFNEACNVYNVDSSSANSWIKKHGIKDKSEGLDAYLKYKEQKCLSD